MSGYVVRILDLSGGAEDNIVEDVPGFPTIEHANAFARAYVVDSLERCRTPELSPEDVLERWFAFGEDAEVLEAAEHGWRSATELNSLAESPATEAARDWRAIDPRRRHASRSSAP